MLAEAGRARVEADVFDRVAEVFLGVDDLRREPIAPEVAAPAVARVEALRVHAVQALHARGEVLLRRVEDGVEVRAEDRVGDRLPLEADHALREEGDPADAVLAAAEGEGVLDRLRRDVEEPVGERRAKYAGH